MDGDAEVVAQALDPELSLAGRTIEWLTGLTAPMRLSRERVEGLVRRTEELKGEIEAKAA